MKIKKTLKAATIFTFIFLLFLFAAFIEFNTNIEIHKQKTKDDMTIIQTRLENIIGTRLVSLNAMQPYIEVNSNFDQGSFEVFAKNIYESKDGLVKDLSFMTGTTITHIYPYEEFKDLLGVDLSQISEQSDWVLFGKNSNKNIMTAPVDLIEGGKGIIIRIPISLQDAYYGQLSIIFDYDKTFNLAGFDKFSKDHLIKLATLNYLKDEELTVWSNSEEDLQNGITKGIGFHGIDLRLQVLPKGGFSGYSTNFLLILIIGLLTASGASVFFYQILTSKEVLEHKNLLLKASEEELNIKYTEILDQKKKNIHISNHDSLTGFYNRQKCIEDLDIKIKEGKEFTIFLFDIDNFKKINDTRGHTYGDIVLKELAQGIRSITKKASNYRIGGDEFLILVPDLQDEAEIVKRLIFAFGELTRGALDGRIDPRITISLGIARYPLDGNLVEDLIMKADLAMYEAKRKGKNQYCFFDNTILENLLDKVEIENQIRHAISSDGFKLLYQPIISKSSGQIESFEALIRFKDANIPPGIFIPIAEETGLIQDVGKWVIDEAIRQLARWRKEGYLLKPLAINISPIQVYNGGLEDYLLNSLRKNDILASLIVLEITESLLLENIEESLESLNRLRRIGCKISLDDFGTGYSSLSYLTYIPVDKVKLDKSIKDKFLLTGNIEVMKVLIDLCHSLDLEVVIEGVETSLELKKLLDTESDYFQGYYFAKPIPPEDAIKLVRIKFEGL